MVPCWGGYFVGRWYGVQALDRLSQRGWAGRVTRAVVRVWGRVGGLLLIVYPGATSSVLAGTNAMPLRRFVPLMLTGLLLSAVLTRVIADSAGGLVTPAAALVEQHAVPLGLVLLAGVVVTQLVRRHAAR
jgi:membrane protein DedA with SNARE-associated domain